MSCTITEHEVQVVVIPDDCNAEPVVITAVDGTSVHYEPEPVEIHINAGPRGLPGTDVDLQKTATHIQWRPRKDGEAWRDLVPLSDLVGPKSFKAGDIIFSMDNPGADWVACDGTAYTGGGPLTALLPGGVLPDFTGSQVPAYICKTATVATNAFILDTDPRLADAREWTAATVDQAEAEAGTATTRRAWTAQRVRQAVLGWWGGFAAKATPVDADSIVIADSAASNAPKRLSWANAVAKLKGTFVEGPASALDGQVMVFDGATGKKAKSGVIGSLSADNLKGLPVLNRLKDGGKFDGGIGDASVDEADFNTGFLIKYTPNGGIFSCVGKRVNNSSSFGGSGPAVSQTTIDLLTVAIPNTYARRYGTEFLIAQYTADAAPPNGVLIGGVTRYLGPLFNNSPGGLYEAQTIAFWIRAVDEPVFIAGNSVSKWGAADRSSLGAHEIIPEQGWLFRYGLMSSTGGNTGNTPYIYCLPGGKVQFAMLTLVPGHIEMPALSVPLPSYKMI